MLYTLSLAAPILPPENISIQIVNSRQLFVSWKPPDKNGRNGIIRMYIINVTGVDSNEGSSERTDTTSITLHVLPFQQYLISVAAVTVERGPFSDGVAIETPEDGKPLTTTKIIMLPFNYVVYC